MSIYQILWFFLVGLLLTVYAILDGFDLGVGFWHLRAKGDAERRSLLNAIGPTWDGNEVWLLLGGGAIFAAFPPVYAAVFSGFYLAMMLVLLALIFRAVSIEFRSKEASPRWRATWDAAFSVSSILATLLLGVALGNILRGIPLDERGNFTGTFLSLLNPYALVVGLLGLVMLACHGALFIAWKTTGGLRQKAIKWAARSAPIYLGFFLAIALITIDYLPHLLENYRLHPMLYAFPVVTVLLIFSALISNRKGKAGQAFLFSSLSIAGLMSTAGVGLFPKLVPALGNPEHSLTAGNASSSQLTLKIMLILALLGLPVVIGYTIWAYRVFHGKVNAAPESDHY